MRWNADRDDATTAHKRGRRTVMSITCLIIQCTEFIPAGKERSVQGLGYSPDITARMVGLSEGTDLSLLQCSDRVRDTQPHKQGVMREIFTRGKAARTRD